VAYYKNGDQELAKKELKRALELDPKFAGAEEAKNTLTQIK
jgi:Tfp pilus assembly protein PilF